MKSFPFIENLTLIGVGLIGGSFALDLKRAGLAGRVCGIDLSPDNLERALERGVIDEAFTEISAQSIADTGLIMIATPVASLEAVCNAVKPFLSPSVLITDVGSTKQSAVEAFRRTLPEHLPRCIAAHPIAGSDRSGATAAQFSLYQDKKLIITPHGAESPDALRTVESLWQAVGAQTFLMDAAEHDAVFAAVSHLPHLAAFAYVHQLSDHPQGKHYLDFAGTGFRDFTRIASSHPAVWADICLANRHSLTKLIADMQNQLAEVKTLLEQNDRNALYRYFDTAKQTRDRWLENQ